MKIRLKNFKGIAAGPELTWDGCKEIEVDFTGRTGLIAFSGENGGGKSTLLENLHHYPQLVSRGGALWQHVMGREAEKEFESNFMGHLYRSVVKMDADQGKQEGYLWRDGVPMVNGKITAYKDAVNDIFGQPFTYFRSQFCPQKSKNTQGMQIENMTAGVFRELLQQFLNLQRYAQWEDTSKQAGNILAGQIAGIDQRIRGLEDAIGGADGVRVDVALTENHLSVKSDGLEIFKQGLAGLRQAIDTLKEKIAANSLAIARRQDLQGQIDRLEGELAEGQKTAAAEIGDIAAEQTALESATARLEDLKGSVATKRAKADTLRATVQENALVAKKRADLQGQLDRLTAELDTAKTDAEKEIVELQDKWRSIDKEIGALGEVLKDQAAVEAAAEQVKALEAQAAEVQTRIDELQADIPGHQAAVHAKETEIATLRQQLKDLDNDPEWTATVKELAAVNEAITFKGQERKRLALDTELAQAGATVKALEAAAMVGDGIDPACQSRTCAAIASVNKAKEDLPAARAAYEKRAREVAGLDDAAAKEISTLIDRALSLQAQRNDQEAAIEADKAGYQEEINTAERDLRNLKQALLSTTEVAAVGRQNLARFRMEIGKQKLLADRLPEIQAAALRKADLATQLADAAERGKTRAAAWGKKRAELEGAHSEAKTALDAVVVDDTAESCLQKLAEEIRVLEVEAIPYLEKTMQESREKVTRWTAKKEAWTTKENGIMVHLSELRDQQCAIIIDTTAEASLASTQAEITEIETVKTPAIEKEIQAARERIATLQAELTRIEAAEKELVEAKAQRDAIALKVSRWRYLQLGCGKTGLQNLRIDGAAPRIIYNANRLLAQAYGARYAIRLETQNEAGKEDLQIKIIMENGQEVYLDDISGGQRAWNVQALWLAMSLLNQEKSGRKYDYFCSDESDGALDVDNAEKYTALYRPFMEEAGLTRLAYISHKPSCRAMADHQLLFEHGKNPVWN